MPDRSALSWPAQLELGVAERPLPGEQRSGDRAVFAAYEGGALVAAIDGLGHGDAAAEAAARAAAVIAERRDEPPKRLIEACHAALARTRGVVMTLAWFDLAAGSLSWTGVGNVEGRLVRAPGGERAPTQGAFTLGGVVGYNLPAIRVTEHGARRRRRDRARDRRDRLRLRRGDGGARLGAGDRRPHPVRARQGIRRRARGRRSLPAYTGMTMKTDIHPEYVEAHVRCTCGNEFTTRSTQSEIRVEICSNCHPFYTGKQKLVDTGGRVERFKRRAAKRAR